MTIKSTSLRLLLIFALGLVVLIALFQIIIGHSLQKEVELLNAQAAHRMTRVMIERHSKDDVNFRRAERFAERSGLRFYIKTAEQEWLSDNDFQSTVNNTKGRTFKNIEVKPLIRHSRPRHKRLPKKIGVIKLTDHRIYKVTTPNVTFLIEIPYQHKSMIGLFFLVALLFLGLMYAAIRYLFSPLNNIRQVVSDVSQGNLAARSNVQRTDEFGDLAQKINLMTEQIQQRIESKHSLLLGISHELRTPLTSARVSTEMLHDGARKQSITEDLTEIERIILELTEAEKLSEHSAVHRTATDINTLVLNLLNESFSEYPLKLTLLTDDPYLNIDATRIKLLIKNLLNNAIKYTPNDKPTPELRLSLHENELTINVTDFGQGIATEQLAKIKEPFHRVDSARHRNTGGFGLGLYLCDVICKAHQGSLDIKSQMNKGTQAIARIQLLADSQANKT